MHFGPCQAPVFPVKSSRYTILLRKGVLTIGRTKFHSVRYIYIYKAGFILLLLLLLLALGRWDSLRRDRQLVGTDILSAEAWAAQKAACTEGSFDPLSLLWEGQRPAYDEISGTIYLPQNMNETAWQGSLQAKDPEGAVYFLEDDMRRDKAGCLAQNYRFSLALVQNGVWSEIDVVFTGLPIICLWGNADDSLSECVVFDPGTESGLAATTATYGSFHRRGSSTARAKDFNIRLTLCNENGEKQNENLLGIRNDDDWILNGLYLCRDLMHEPLAYWLWEEVNALEDEPMPASSMTYVELVWNDHYRGVYALMPRLDAKQLDLKEGDIAYKIRDYGLPTEEDFALSEGSNDLISSNPAASISIIYPKEGGSWDPLQDYLSLFEGDDHLLEPGGNELDVENHIRYNLFLELIQGIDNRIKNGIIIARLQPDGSYRFYRTVWDMDLSFGIDWGLLINGTPEQIASRQPTAFGDYTEPAALRLMANDPESYFAALQELWARWQEAGINAEACFQRLDEQQSYLIDGGALARNAEHRGETNPDDLSGLEGWIETNFQNAEAYFAELEVTG